MNQFASFRRAKRLTGSEKSAILFLCLGEERGSALMQQLDTAEISKITRAISAMGEVQAEIVEEVMREFGQKISGYGGITGSVEAARGLLKGFLPEDRVDEILKEIEGSNTGDGWTEAAVRKDAGDDPDVTDKALIRVRLQRTPAGSGITFHAGDGVGTVTRAGLPIPPEEPAINPVPRQMIRQALEETAAEHGGSTDLGVTISVDGGMALAEKTWNPRLGIVGGISILGTTGIVRPFSCAAWIASIHRGVDVARAAGLTHVLGSTGATSEATAQQELDLPDIACLDMGDFAGGLLKYLRTHPVERVTIAGGFAKITKLAQGELDLHSSRSQVDFNRLAETATAFADPDRIRGANTAAEALQIAGQGLAQTIAKDAMITMRNVLRGAPIQPQVMIVARDGEMLAREGVTA